MTRESAHSRYSVSRIRRYLGCAHSFKLHYIDKLPPAPSLPSLLGRIVHSVLERTYYWILQDEFSGSLNRDQILDLYRDETVRQSLKDYTLFTDGLKMLEAYVEDAGDVDCSEVLATEVKFEVEIAGRPFIGFMDLVERFDATSICITDFKTNRLLFSRDEVDSDLQLSIYCLVAEELWPWATSVDLCFHMLRHRVKLFTQRSPEQLAVTREFTAAVIGQIESETEYAPNLSTNCVNCDHASQCTAYQGASEATRATLGIDAMASVGAERQRVVALIKILEKRKKEIDETIKSKLEKAETFDSGGSRFSMSKTTYTSYPVPETVKLVAAKTGMPEEEVGKRILSVVKKDLDGLVKEVAKGMSRPEAQMFRHQLEALSEKTYSPRLVVKSSSG